MALDPIAARWFEARRGIKKSTVEAFGVHTERRDLVFPYPRGLKKRRYSTEDDNPFGLDKEGRRFTWEDETGGPAGAGQVPFMVPDFEAGKFMFLFEGETDTMAAWQNAPEDVRKRIVGISGTGSFEKSGAADLFAEATTVFVVFDNDDPYVTPEAAKSTEGAWRKVRTALGPKARRVVLPQGCEDVADFFQKYPGWGAFKVLLDAAREPRMNYPRLDLSKEPPPTEWLVEGLIAANDVTMVYGDGGVSKSLFQQALAVAIVKGDEHFLGHKLNRKGRVLYIDEENPEDVVRQRLAKLGLTNKDEAYKSLWYVQYGGVRIDEEPEKLFDDVAEWQPEVLFLDSFSQVQNAGENEVAEMTRVIKAAVFPISRVLKVPVLVLHHSNKDGGVRGSTQIRNAADLSLRIEADKSIIDQYHLSPDKPRRGQSLHITYKVNGYDVNGEPNVPLDEEVRLELTPIRGGAVDEEVY